MAGGGSRDEPGQFRIAQRSQRRLHHSRRRAQQFLSAGWLGCRSEQGVESEGGLFEKRQQFRGDARLQRGIECEDGAVAGREAIPGQLVAGGEPVKGLRPDAVDEGVEGRRILQERVRVEVEDAGGRGAGDSFRVGILLLDGRRQCA